MAEIEGLKELSAQLKKLGLIDNKSLTRAAYELLKWSKVNAPVKTGALRENSGVIEDDGNPAVEFRQAYAWYQEAGNGRGYKGKKYVSRAIEEHEEDILNAAAKGIQDDIDKNI